MCVLVRLIGETWRSCAVGIGCNAMPCYYPIPAYQAAPGERVKLNPSPRERFSGKGQNFNLPCGGCIGCKTDRATEWAKRCEHEADSWDHNSFVTLSYTDEHLPSNGDLKPQDLTRFIKRLRKYANSTGSRLDRDRGAPPRYFACGEYGDLRGRPHYHALLFNCGFPDLVKVGTASNGEPLYESEILGDLWPFGSNRVGRACGASAAYIAQYSLKKSGSTYRSPDGALHPPPFLRMSRFPVIGSAWLRQFSSDLQHGYLVSDGRPGRIPRAYLNVIRRQDPAFAEEIKFKSLSHRTCFREDDLPERKRDAEAIHKARKLEAEKSRSL